MWIKNNLRKLREERGLVQKFVAKQVGCSSAHISRIEHGKEIPTRGELWRLAEILGVEPDAIYPRIPEGLLEVEPEKLRPEFKY